MNRSNPDLEAPVLHSVIVQLGSIGIELWRRNVVAFKIGKRFVRCAEPGQADLWGVDYRPNGQCQGPIWARHWEIEVKANGKRPSLAQILWLKRMTRLGCVAFWGDNVDTIFRVAQSVMDGGRIAWIGDRDEFDVFMP